MEKPKLFLVPVFVTVRADNAEDARNEICRHVDLWLDGHVKIPPEDWDVSVGAAVEEKE